MVSLKESVVKGYIDDLNKSPPRSYMQFFGEWVEGYIKQLEQYLERLYKLPLSQLDPNDSINVILNFLRDENK